MKSLRYIQRWCCEFIDTLFPRRCHICCKVLKTGERYICSKCYMQLPFTRWHGRPGNGMERLFWARIPIERANALIHYYSGDDSRKIVLDIKYHRQTLLGVYLGRIMATDLQDTDFFNGINAIVPVPLATKRLRKRRYNQSEMLAKGVAEITGIPVLKNVIERIKDNPSQTHLTSVERKENVKDIFRVIDQNSIMKKHILLIDDVITTGATILSCAKELVKVSDVRISILTLFIAGRHAEGPVV